MNLSHEVEINVGPADVWAGLTQTELTRHYYFGMDVSSDWIAGHAIVYQSPIGDPAESGLIVSIETERHLETETRFLFAPAGAEEPLHRTRWELEPRPGGTHVRLIYSGFEPGSFSEGVVRNDDGVLLSGLRLAVDPALRAGLARLDQVGEVTIRDVVSAGVAGYQRFFDEEAFRDNPAWQACYCSETSIAEPDGAPPRPASHNRAEMTARIESGQVTGLLAFDGERPIGWCNYGPTKALHGLVKRFGLSASDQEGVGSIGCFVIAPQYRRHGVARRLLAAACDRLAALGIDTVEAYPNSTARTEADSYRGSLAMYLSEGFATYREIGRTIMVRRRLKAEPDGG